MRRRRLLRWCLVAAAAAALAPAEASAIPPHRFCGTYETPRGEEVRVYVRGASCVEAIRVARAFHVDFVRMRPWFCGLAHGPGAQRSPFSCGWGGERGDLRKWPHSIVVRMDPPTAWSWPVERPAASASAQAFMPLVFLDDDEHWSITDPDWFCANANVQHCRFPVGDCARLDRRTIRDGSRRWLRFNREDGRDGPDAMFVNQVEPGQPPYPGGVPVSGAYRFFDYWWFYPFNRGPYGWSKPIAGSFDHLSDWEGVTVATLPGRDDAFEFAALSAHEAAWNYLPGVLRCGEGLDGDERHETGCAGRRRLNVYAAEGTHANFPRRCDHSLLELNPFKRGICEQTGYQEVEGVLVHLPEGRFNGKDDKHAGMDPATLRTLAPVAQWDWTGYEGFWDDTGDVLSPNLQDRFRNPMSGKRACTPRWSGDNTRVDCDDEFGGGGSSARLHALTAQAAGAVDPCEAWFGPMVQAAVCRPAEVAAALRDGRIGTAGDIGITGTGGAAASGNGITQVLGAPLRAGDAISIAGTAGPADVRVRVQGRDRAVDLRFDGAPVGAGGPVTVAVDPGGTVTARAADGSALAPSASRRVSTRRPPRLRRVTVRRSGGRVVVRFARVRDRVEVALLVRRGGRPVAGTIVRGRRGRAIVGLPRRTIRYVAVRRLSRTLIPSRPQIVRLRR